MGRALVVALVLSIAAVGLFATSLVLLADADSAEREFVAGVLGGLGGGVALAGIYIVARQMLAHE